MTQAKEVIPCVSANSHLQIPKVQYAIAWTITVHFQNNHICKITMLSPLISLSFCMASRCVSDFHRLSLCYLYVSITMILFFNPFSSLSLLLWWLINSAFSKVTYGKIIHFCECGIKSFFPNLLCFVSLCDF